MANLGDILSVPASPATGGATPVYIPTGGNSGDNGLVSAILLSSLLGNRGGIVGNGVVDAANGFATTTNAISLNEILSTLGDIKASVPLAEGQVQLALAGAVQALTAQANDNTQTLAQGQSNILLSNVTNQASLARDIANVNATAAVNTASILEAVRDEGVATRGLITTNQIAELNRIAAERQDEIIELRNASARDRDRHGIEINMINNQNQIQLQFQQQQQILGTLSHGLVDALQSIRATNQAINIGGTQSASPTNSNTNVRG